MERLVPLPDCEGPKLEPFTQNFENLEFEPELVIRETDEFAHSMVVKAKMNGKSYAIKLFVYEFKSMPIDSSWPSLTKEELALAKIQSDPFHAECRAFGRLKEVGQEHLAVKAYGYVKIHLNERTAEMFRPAFSMIKYGAPKTLEEFLEYGHLNPETGETKPIMGIVKEWIDGGERIMQEFIPPDEDLEDTVEFLGHAPELIRKLHQIHKYGITVRDIHGNQYIRGQLVDLSYSWTVPHVLAQGDRFRPDWSFASFAAFDLYSLQDIINTYTRILRKDVRDLRSKGADVGWAKVPSVRCYCPRHPVTRQGLRPLPHRAAKYRPLLHYIKTYNPDCPDGNPHLLRWTDGPLYDPGQFRWQDIGKEPVVEKKLVRATEALTPSRKRKRLAKKV